MTKGASHDRTPNPHPTTRTHYHACMLCEAICGLAIEVGGERIVSIRGDAQDPLSHIHPKGVAHQDCILRPRPAATTRAPYAARLETIGCGEALYGTAPSTDGFDLALIGRRHLRSNNSWMHNSPRLVKGREPLRRDAPSR